MGDGCILMMQCWLLPSQCEDPMLDEGGFFQHLGQEVSWLVFRVDLLNDYVFIQHVRCEMETLAVDVFGAGTNLRYLCNMYRRLLVLKQSASERHAWVRMNAITFAVHLSQDALNGNHRAQCH
jgi:hypothetical protein